MIISFNGKKGVRNFALEITRFETCGPEKSGDNGRKHFPLFLYLMLTVHALTVVYLGSLVDRHHFHILT